MADTPELGTDVAAMVCHRSPLQGIGEGTVFTGELDTPYTWLPLAKIYGTRTMRK